MAAAASESRQIIIVDGGDRKVCEATDAASICELRGLEAKIHDLSENIGYLEKKLLSADDDDERRAAWLALQAAEPELEQVNEAKRKLESCVTDQLYSQAVEWQAEAHLLPDKSAFEKNFKELFAKLSCLQKVVLARLLGWGGTAIVGAAREITVRPEYLH